MSLRKVERRFWQEGKMEVEEEKMEEEEEDGGGGAIGGDVRTKTGSD